MSCPLLPPHLKQPGVLRFTKGGALFSIENVVKYSHCQLPPVLEINFFLLVASPCYLVFKVVAKLTYLVAITGGHITAQLPPIVRLMTKQNSVWSKALIMPLTTWNYIWFYKKEKKFSDSECACSCRKLLPQQTFQIAAFCYPGFLPGGKWDFLVANLLLAIVNFEP